MDLSEIMCSDDEASVPPATMTMMPAAMPAMLSQRQSLLPMEDGQLDHHALSRPAAATPATPATPAATTPLLPASAFALPPKPLLPRRLSSDIAQQGPPANSDSTHHLKLDRAPVKTVELNGDFRDSKPPQQQQQQQHQQQQQQQQQQQIPLSQSSFARTDASNQNANLGNNQKFPSRRPNAPQQQPHLRDGFVRRPSAGPNAPPASNGKRSVEDAFPGLTMGAKNIKSTLINQMKFDAQKSIQLSSAAISKVVSASNDHSAMAVENSNDSNKPKPLLFSPAYQPPEWKFKLNLPQDPSLPSDKNDPSFVTLTTCSIIRRPGFPTFLLDGEYTLKSTLPRSYFNILHSHTVQHNFVFNFTNPEHTLFKEMAGLRKTGYFNIKEAGSNEEWELHLKQSRERTNFFGYLVRASDLRNFIQQRMAMIVASRKLPLVLDLDDTLVRMIGNEEGRYVPPQQALQVPERVRTLTDGRRVVLTERVEEFLQWAQRYFEISVCSVGDQPYVDMVIGVLDPQRSNIRGQGYSARAEFMHIQGTSMSKRPPKDLDSLFVFPQKSLDPTGLFCGPFVDPLVIDDNVGMWPVEQQDNIIVVREQKGAKVWNVQLFPHVQTVLQSVHTEFFKQLDNWDHKNAGPANLGPSSRQIYKEFLRNEYARRMAEPVATMTIQQQQQHPQQQSLGGGMSISPPPVAAAALRATPSSIPVVVGPPAASDIGISGLASLVSPLIHSLQQHHGGGGTGVSSIAVNPVASPLVGTFTLPDD